jgi:hypothetical protein
MAQELPCVTSDLTSRHSRLRGIDAPNPAQSSDEIGFGREIRAIGRWGLRPLQHLPCEAERPCRFCDLPKLEGAACTGSDAEPLPARLGAWLMAR